jgi:hypothetical protein
LNRSTFQYNDERKIAFRTFILSSVFSHDQFLISFDSANSPHDSPDMGNTLDAITRGVKAGVAAVKEATPHRFEAAGKAVVCAHCGNDTFNEVGVLGVSFGGYGISCTKCTRIEYFLKAPSQAAKSSQVVA